MISHCLECEILLIGAFWPGVAYHFQPVVPEVLLCGMPILVVCCEQVSQRSYHAESTASRPISEVKFRSMCVLFL